MATKRTVGNSEVDATDGNGARKKLKFNEITPSRSSTVEGIISSLTPMKNKYFEGELTDGDTCIRIVGFDPCQQQKLASFCKEKTPVKISNCEIKKARSSDNCEILVKRYSGVQLSPTRFNDFDISNVGSKDITLSNISQMKQYDKVTVKAKVIKVNPVVLVGTGKHKQDVHIADNTGCTVLTLWEDDIDMLEEGQSYHLSKLIVQLFQGSYSLSFGSVAVATAIEDLANVIRGDMCTCTGQSQPLEYTLASMEIVSVCISKTYMCLSCGKSSQVMELDEEGFLGKCTKCNTTQKLSKCKKQVMAKLGLLSPNNEYVAVKAYEDILNEITGSQCISEKMLIEAMPFTVSYNEYNLVTSVSRPAPLDNSDS